MSEPLQKGPLPRGYEPIQRFEDPEKQAGNICQVPPAFNLEASTTEMPGEYDPQQRPLVCEEGKQDPLTDALSLAFASTKNQWAKKELTKIEPILIATRNILDGSGAASPMEGDLNHPATYADWGLAANERKALWDLYKAMYESEDVGDKAKLLSKAKAVLKKPLQQVKSFAASKTFAATPGFKELAQAVEDGIHAKIAGIQAVIDASKPKKTKTPSKSGGGGGGSSKGFNRQVITDQTLLPGLSVDAEAPAPAADSMAAAVEANMQRDLIVNSGSVEDFLYVNIPDIIAKSDTARSMWHKIKSYRDKNLTAVFGAYITKPDDEAAKLAYHNAIAKMEAELGPEIRSMAKNLWFTDTASMKAAHEKGKPVQADVTAQKETFDTTIKASGFDPAALDKETFKTNIERLKQSLTDQGQAISDLELNDKTKKNILPHLTVAKRELTKATKALSKKKLTNADTATVLQALTKAEEKVKASQEALDAHVKAVEKRNESHKAIIAHIEDPAKVPLVKEVKRHGVSVTFKGSPDGEEVTASYGTKPESMIGIYENVWSPRSISDKAGNFDRPGGAQRGAQVYQELKDVHGYTESEAKIMGSVSTGEGDYHSVNSVDIMRISLGFIQFAGASFTGLLQDLKAHDPEFFKKQFEQYGIIINDGKTKLPPLTDRKARFIPGAEHGQDTEETNRTNDKLIVYDHSARVWVSGLEAFAILQSDPRYLTLIQSSAKNPSMQYAQIKRAKEKYHNATRLANIEFDEVGLEEPEGKESFEVRDVYKNELCAYAITATAIGGGPGSGISLAKKVIKALVAEKKIKTLEELQALPQTELVRVMKKLYDKWSRPTKFGEESKNPLSDTTYDGTY